MVSECVRVIDRRAVAAASGREGDFSSAADLFWVFRARFLRPSHYVSSRRGVRVSVRWLQSRRSNEIFHRLLKY